MAQLAFFPWFAVRENLQVGAYQLLRYERGALPANGQLQAHIDGVLESYKDLTRHPVQRATILTVGDRGLTDDMPWDVHAEMFAFGDMVALAGLSSRRFFEHFSYCNRDNLRLIIQGFREDTGGSLVTSRRRDGSASTYVTADVDEVRCPHHVKLTPFTLDVPLLSALVEGPQRIDLDTWMKIFQAMVLFNEANTDREYMPEYVEMILSFASLEQLLDRAGGDPRGVADAFSHLWVPDKTLPRDEWTLQPTAERPRRRLERAPSLRYGWLEDMGVSRGSVAHGHGEHAYPGIWGLADHLLFAAFVVPRVFKLRLAQIGLYNLTPDDQSDIDILEALLNERHLVARDPDDHTPFPWIRIMAEGLLRRIG